jgi:hypothetical protein
MRWIDFFWLRLALAVARSRVWGAMGIIIGTAAGLEMKQIGYRLLKMVDICTSTDLRWIVNYVYLSYIIVLLLS